MQRHDPENLKDISEILKKTKEAFDEKDIARFMDARVIKTIKESINFNEMLEDIRVKGHDIDEEDEKGLFEFRNMLMDMMSKSNSGLSGDFDEGMRARICEDLKHLYEKGDLVCIHIPKGKEVVKKYVHVDHQKLMDVLIRANIACKGCRASLVGLEQGKEHPIPEFMHKIEKLKEERGIKRK